MCLKVYIMPMKQEASRTKKLKHSEWNAVHYSLTMLPDQDIFGLQVRNYLSTKLAEVLGVLTDLHLLNLFPQTGTVPHAWFTEVCSSWERKTPLQVHSPRGHIPHTFQKVWDKITASDLPEGYTKINKKEALEWKSPYLPTIAAFLVRFVCHVTTQAQQ